MTEPQVHLDEAIVCPSCGVLSSDWPVTQIVNGHGRLMQLRCSFCGHNIGGKVLMPPEPEPAPPTLGDMLDEAAWDLRQIVESIKAQHGDNAYTAMDPNGRLLLAEPLAALGMVLAARAGLS